MAEGELDVMAKEAARGVVAELAPAEVEAFEDAIAPRAPKGRRTDEDSLAFGLQDLALLVAPIALAAAKAALMHIVMVVKQEGSESLRERVRAFFRRNEKESLEWKRLHQAVYDNAVAAGAEADQATLIANATVGRLLTGA